MERFRRVAIPVSAGIVVLIAWALRVFNLDTLPPGIDRDVATNGVYTLYVLHEGLRPLFYRIGAIEPLIVYLQSFSVALLGVGVFPLRIVTAAVGMLTVPALYAVARLARAKWTVAMVAAFGLAISVEHIHLSRLGLRAILIPLAELLLLYLFWRGWRDGRLRYFVAAGVVLGVAYYTYTSAIFLVLVPAAFVGHRLVFARAELRTRWRGVIATGAVALVIAAPLVIFEILYPQAAFFRASQVTLFQHPDYDRFGLLGVLALKILSQLKMFGIQWEGQYNPLSQPLLDPFWFVAFLVGLAVCLRNAKRIEYAWGPLLIGVMLLPDLVGGNELFPQELRIIGVIPPTFFCAAVGLVSVFDWAGARRPALKAAAGPILAVILAGALVYSFSVYFVGWQAQVRATDDPNFVGADVAEGKWIAHASLPVLVELNEYARQPVRYLAGARAPVLVSALDAAGTIKPGLLDGRGLVMLSNAPDRFRFEGRTYANDPLAYVLVRDGSAYLLPPLQDDLAANLQAAEPVDTVPYPFGYVARVYSVDLAALRFAARPATPPVAFSSDVTLLGYSLDSPRVRPGDAAPLTLWWLPARRLQDDEMIFVHVLDVDGNVAANADVLPALGAYPTFVWKPGEAVVTHHQIKIPARTRPGRYTVEIGMYSVLDGERLNVLDARGAAIDSRLTVGNLKVAPAQPPAYVPEQVQIVDFGDRIALAGYHFARGDDAGQFRVSLYWRALTAMSDDYTVFVHVLDGEGKIVAQSDHQPQSGAYPTSIWEAGENVRDDFVLSVPKQVANGKYRVEIGWYDLKSGARLSVRDASNQTAADHALLDSPLEVQR